MRRCFTLNGDVAGGQYGKFVADWGSSQQASYNGGSPLAAGTSDISDKQPLHMAWRQQKELKRVYSYFRLDRNWLGVDKSNNPVWPQLKAVVGGVAGPGTPGENFWYPGLRLEHRLPLLTDHDYTGDNVKKLGGLVNDTTPAGGQAEFLRPMVFTWDSVRDFYQHIERHSAAQDIELIGQVSGDGRPWSCSVRMQDNAPGFVLQGTVGAQHLIAGKDFTPADASDTADAGMLQPECDWRQFIATVFPHGDCWAEQIYPSPEAPLPGPGDVGSRS